MNKQIFDSYVNSVVPRFEGHSPTIVNNIRFHTLLKDYLIPVDPQYVQNPYVQDHQLTCECESVPKHIVEYLAARTKVLLDKYDIKFGYGTFARCDSINKQRIKPHLHIQSVFDKIEHAKEIAFFVSFGGEYEVEYYTEVLDAATVIDEKLYLRNTEDRIEEYVKDLDRKSVVVHDGDAILFDGQYLIHGGTVLSGCGIWVVLSLCTSSEEVGSGMLKLLNDNRI